MPDKIKLKVALDWTPNTIHSGLYLALEKNLYAYHGLEVELLPPDADYSITPAKRLEKGDVDLAICPSESCIAYNETGRMKLQAIYAILHKDASAIASTKHSEITALDDGTYGSYNAKYEDDIVRAMITSAGGKAENMKTKGSTGKLSLFDEVRRGDVDATWVFLPWEGVEAELEGVPFYAFKPEDYGVPYGYSPIIARNAASSPPAETLRKFVDATAKGYEHVIRDSREAAAVLSPHCSPARSAQFLARSQEYINDYYRDGSSPIGYMQPARWDAWTGWLKDRGLLKKELASRELFSNEFFA